MSVYKKEKTAPDVCSSAILTGLARKSKPRSEDLRPSEKLRHGNGSR